MVSEGLKSRAGRKEWDQVVISYKKKLNSRSFSAGDRERPWPATSSPLCTQGKVDPRRIGLREWAGKAADTRFDRGAGRFEVPRMQCVQVDHTIPLSPSLPPRRLY